MRSVELLVLYAQCQPIVHTERESAIENIRVDARLSSILCGFRMAVVASGILRRPCDASCQES